MARFSRGRMRRVSLSRSASLLALALVACSAAPGPRAELALPGPSSSAGAPPPPPPLVPRAEEPHDLPGVKVDELTHRERRMWWKFVSQLYAPCSDQPVSIAQCIEEHRNCGACAPAAGLLAAKIREGATEQQLQELYAERFGPNAFTPDLAGSPMLGDASAPVTIVEWFDFECPHCRLALPALEKLVQKHKGDVRLVKKFYPLKQHLRAEACARASIAAHAQGKYFEMEKLVFDNKDALEDADLLKYASSLQLDMNRFQADMKSAKTETMLSRDRDEADKFGLSGTPFILIDGHPFDLNYFHFESDLDPWVDLEVKLKKR